MRLAAIFRETARNILSGTTRFTLLGSLLAIVLMSLMTAEVMTIARQITSANDYQREGGNTQIVTATGRIDPTACRRLGALPNVIAAGAIRETSEKLTIATLPNAPAAMFEVTPGFMGLLEATASSGQGISVSKEIAGTLHVQVGDHIRTTTHGNVRVNSTYRYPDDGRRPGFGYAALVETSDLSDFDECWVRSWPEPTNLRELLLTTVDPGKTRNPATIEVSKLNPSLGSSLDPYSGFFARTTRYAAPVALLIAVVMGYASIRARRLQIASALHAGIVRSDISAIAMLETGAWTVPAAIISVCFATIAIGWIPPLDRIAVFQNLLPIPISAVAGAVIGVGIGATTAKERHLFNYFKDR